MHIVKYPPHTASKTKISGETAFTY